jgi:UDP-GlcNAc:undecaprenyl-phosphate GlcNAc-1-phosphate transferase
VGLLFGALFAGSFVITLALVPLVMRLARRTGFLDMPGPRKVHTYPVPYGGGLAVAAGVLLPLAGGVAVAWLITQGHTLGLPGDLRLHARGVMSRAHELALLAGGALVILALGLVDDKRKLGPGFKLAVQALVATGFVAGGERLSLFWEGSRAGDIVGGAVTVLWIVGVTNAFNLLDHMDGISAGVAGLSAAAFAIIAVFTGQLFVAAALLAVMGACAGFLCFNFPPARIYLGDAGSLFVGYMLGTLTVTFTFYEKAQQQALHAYFVPLVVLGVALFDTTTVVVIRIARGKPVFEGDRNHLAHRLLGLGMSRRGTVLTVWTITILTGLSALLLYQVRELYGAIIVVAQLVLTFAVITLLESAGRTHGGGEDPKP